MLLSFASAQCMKAWMMASLHNKHLSCCFAVTEHKMASMCSCRLCDERHLSESLSGCISAAHCRSCWFEFGAHAVSGMLHCLAAPLPLVLLYKLNGNYTPLQALQHKLHTSDVSVNMAAFLQFGNAMHWACVMQQIGNLCSMHSVSGTTACSLSIPLFFVFQFQCCHATLSPPISFACRWKRKCYLAE